MLWIGTDHAATTFDYQKRLMIDFWNLKIVAPQTAHFLQFCNFWASEMSLCNPGQHSFLPCHSYDPVALYFGKTIGSSRSANPVLHCCWEECVLWAIICNSGEAAYKCHCVHDGWSACQGGLRQNLARTGEFRLIGTEHLIRSTIDLGAVF